MQDPHVNVLKVKTLGWDFDVLAFIHIGLRGLIGEGLECGGIGLGD